jgi:hypothetical protein
MFRINKSFMVASLATGISVVSGFAEASGPVFLNQLETENPGVVQQKQPKGQKRNPATEPRGPAAEPMAPSSAQPTAKGKTAPQAGRSESQAAGQRPAGTQLSYIQLSPALGSITVKGRSAFTLGTNVSFRIARELPLYFEPSLFISFLSGDNGTQNATLYHLDAGLRYDFAINDSALVPFLKAAVGGTISSSSSTVVNGEELANSYANFFIGGGLQVLINPSIGARIDIGEAIQGTDGGLYAMGSVALPL